MKYIILKDDNGLSHPVLFPECINHDRIAAMCCVVFSGMGVDNVKPVSAGHVAVRLCETFGDSTSLRLNPDEGDAGIIEAADG